MQAGHRIIKEGALIGTNTGIATHVATHPVVTVLVSRRSLGAMALLGAVEAVETATVGEGVATLLGCSLVVGTLTTGCAMRRIHAAVGSESYIDGNFADFYANRLEMVRMIIGTGLMMLPLMGGITHC